MHPKFATLVETLAPKLDLLISVPPLAYGALPRTMPKSGVYLFTEAGRHLYFGDQMYCGGATAVTVDQGPPIDSGVPAARRPSFILSLSRRS